MELIPQEQAVKKSIERFKHNLQRPVGLYGHDCGIHPINMAIGGLVSGKLTTIAARSGIGKTAFEIQMLSGIARETNGRKGSTLLFSWELTADYVVDRYISYKTGLSNRALTQGVKLLSKDQQQDVRHAYIEAKQLPVHYHEMSLDIRALLRIADKWMKSQEGLDAGIMIDYLGLAKLNSQGNRTYSISDFVNGLKGFANSTGAWVVMLTQISRDSDPKRSVNKKGEEYWTNEDGPSRDDLADSRSIEDASDNLIILHRPEHFGMSTVKDPNDYSVLPSKGITVGKVEKSRDYGISKFLMRSDVALNRFWDMDDRWDTPYWERYKDEDFWRKQL